MTAVAVLLFAVGASDIVRLMLSRVLGRRSARVIGVVIGAAVAGIGGALLELGGWSLVVLVVPLWQLATRPEHRRSSMVAVGLLGLAVVVLVGAGGIIPGSSGPLLDWYDALPYPALDAVPVDAVLIVVASIMFLAESANVVVRLVLFPIATKEAKDSPPSTRPVLFRSPEDVLDLPLPGGRLIGPLERTLILLLALVGQYTAIGAVVAAKGIIRFPEISKDTTGGTKAEFFIVGSLASWVLVAGAVGLARLASG